jgi:hypothetical protein
MLFSLNVAWKRTRLPALKGNNHYKILQQSIILESDTILSTITEMIAIKTYNSKIKSETKVPKVYFISPIVLFAGFFEGDA